MATDSNPQSGPSGGAPATGGGGDNASASIFTESKELYFSSIKLWNEICHRLKAGEVTDCTAIRSRMDAFKELLRKDERMLLGLVNAPYTFVKRQIGDDIRDEIVIHGVNTMIYSLKIVVDIGIPENRIPYIGIAALCKSIGLLDLDPGAIAQMTSNAAAPMPAGDVRKYIKLIKIADFHADSLEFLVNLIQEERQVLNKTTLNEAMYQYAMIIHVCSEFERLTHHKTYGEVIAPVDAMKKMRDGMQDYFHPDIIKLFFNKLSIYPLGSFVRLSSNEIAKIVAINENFIMRPTILVVIDNEGREKSVPTRINLREKPNIYIKKAILDDFLTEKFIDLF